MVHEDFINFLCLPISALPKNEILRIAKAQGIKIRRQEGLKIIGEFRKIPLRPLAERQKYIPKKYRKKIRVKPPKKPYTYFRWLVRSAPDEEYPLLYSVEKHLLYKDGIQSLNSLIEKEVKPIIKKEGLTKGYLDFSYGKGTFQVLDHRTVFKTIPSTVEKEVHKEILLQMKK